MRTGYAGFWIGPKYTFLSDGGVILSGELGPDVSWVHQGQAGIVRTTGPDALVVDPDLAPALEARLRALGCTFERTESIGQVVYHHFSRRPSLEDLAGFDVESPRGGPRRRIPPNEPTELRKPKALRKWKPLIRRQLPFRAARRCGKAKRQSVYTIEYL